MDPRLRFLMALRNLYNKGAVKTINEAMDFAKREFGEINDLFKRQIEQVFKKPVEKTPKPGEGGITSIKNAPKKKDETAQASGSIMDQIEASKNKIEGASNRITEIQKEIDQMYKPKPETSPLMERLEKGIETLKTMKQPGMDLTVGLTRTAVRKILDRSGIQVPDKADPIDFFVQEFGADALMDVKNVAEEMIEIESMGKATKSMDEILEQTGMFNIKRDPNAPKGISNEELEQIKKEVDQEKQLKDFDPTDREPNSKGGLNTLMASNDMNERLLEKLYEDFLEQGFSPEEAARKAREAFSERSDAAMGGRIGYADGPEDPKNKKGIMKVIKKIPKVGKAVGGLEAAYNALSKKFGSDVIKTADEIPPKEPSELAKAVQGFESRNLKMTDIINDVKKLSPIDAMKEVNEVVAKRGKYKNLSDEQVKKIFDDTQDHIFERDVKPSEFDVNFDDVDEAYGMAPKMAERFELKRKYPGIDDDLLTAIIDDPDPNNKAQVLATLEQLMALQRQGKTPEEAVDIIKQTMFKGRRDNSKGGLQYLMGL